MCFSLQRIKPSGAHLQLGSYSKSHRGNKRNQKHFRKLDVICFSICLYHPLWLEAFEKTHLEDPVVQVYVYYIDFCCISHNILDTVQCMHSLLYMVLKITARVSRSRRLSKLNRFGVVAVMATPAKRWGMTWCLHLDNHMSTYINYTVIISTTNPGIHRIL